MSTAKLYLTVLALASSSILFSSCTQVDFPNIDNKSKAEDSSKGAGEGKKTGGADPGPGTDPGAEPGTSGEDPGEGKSSQPGSDSDSGGEPEPGPGGGGEEPSGDCEEGEVDRNCHFLPDGSPIKFPKGLPVGNCKAGTRVCEDGKWGACKGAVAPKKSDDCSVPGDDADCDGVPNGGCDCTTGDKRDCGESNVGACKIGKQYCEDGVWSKECKGAVYPSDEICDGNGIDEDCDGKADVKDTECDCINGEEKYCQRPGTRLKGDCRIGKQKCKEGKWQGCEEWAKPIREICGKRDPVTGVNWTGDENCDGGVDTSPFGKKGPEGCTEMMLDADGDGWGRIGLHLDRIAENQKGLLGMACLCENREDMDKKYAEGWVRTDPRRENADCGDCSYGSGNLVHPGSRQTTHVPNRCLSDTPWKALEQGFEVRGSFDMDCSGRHEIDGNLRDWSPIRCERIPNTMRCQMSNGSGMLRTRGRVRCGMTYDFGQCFGKTKKVKKKNPNKPEDPGGTGGDDGTGGETGGGGGGGGSTEPDFIWVEVFDGCGVRATGQRVTIPCG